jgi:type I site-specific restriction-modification system R (restriction) subunit
MVAKDKLREIAKHAHQYAKSSYYSCYSYKDALKDGFKVAWDKYYHKQKEVLANTLADVYKAAKEYASDGRVMVEVARDLRKKGLNCILILYKSRCNRSVKIRFAASDLLKDFILSFNLQYTSVYSAECVLRTITNLSPHVERNAIIDELLAELA